LEVSLPPPPSTFSRSSSLPALLIHHPVTSFPPGQSSSFYIYNFSSFVHAAIVLLISPPNPPTKPPRPSHLASCPGNSYSPSFSMSFPRLHSSRPFLASHSPLVTAPPTYLLPPQLLALVADDPFPTHPPGPYRSQRTSLLIPFFLSLSGSCPLFGSPLFYSISCLPISIPPFPHYVI